MCQSGQIHAYWGVTSMRFPSYVASRGWENSWYFQSERVFLASLENHEMTKKWFVSPDRNGFLKCVIYYLLQGRVYNYQYGDSASIHEGWFHPAIRALLLSHRNLKPQIDRIILLVLTNKSVIFRYCYHQNIIKSSRIGRLWLTKWSIHCWFELLF